jgi:hypothetical protein
MMLDVGRFLMVRRWVEVDGLDRAIAAPCYSEPSQTLGNGNVIFVTSWVLR